jgi:hypothetical protein
VSLLPPKNLDDPAVAFAHFGGCQQWIQLEGRPRPVPRESDDLILDINIDMAIRHPPKERSRSADGRDLVDEHPDVSFDFVAWQALALPGVWQAEIAADDGGAQPFAGQGAGPSAHGKR